MQEELTRNFNNKNYQFSFDYPGKWDLKTYDSKSFYERESIKAIIPSEYRDQMSFEYDVDVATLSYLEYDFDLCTREFVPEYYKTDLYYNRNFSKNVYIK